MDRRSRGKRKSSNCFQRCLTFSFLRFMADPEMELVKRVDRRRLAGLPDAGMSGPRGVGPKNKKAPTVVGAQFSTGVSLQEPHLVCQEENARKRAEARLGAVAWGAICKQQHRLVWGSCRLRRGPDFWRGFCEFLWAWRGAL